MHCSVRIPELHFTSLLFRMKPLTMHQTNISTITTMNGVCSMIQEIWGCLFPTHQIRPTPGSKLGLRRSSKKPLKSYKNKYVLVTKGLGVARWKKN